MDASPLNRCWKLYQVRRGEGKIVFDRGEQVLRPRRLYLINGHRIVHQACADAMEVDWLHFQPTSWRLRLRLEQLPPAVHLPGGSRSWSRSGLAPVRTLFHQTAHAYRALGGLRPDARPETYLRVLGALLNVLGEVLESPSGQPAAPPDIPPPLQSALDYMERHYLEHPPLALLARQSGWQPEHFHRRFHRMFGLTPLAFMQRRRLEDSVHLLTETNLTVKEVAARLRFSSPFYFTRVFTRHFGTSPTAFRLRSTRLG